jgi:hypothetical protein
VYSTLQGRILSATKGSQQRRFRRAPEDPSMLSAPTRSTLGDTAIAAAGGGTLLTLDADGPRPGRAHATVLVAGRLVQVALDRALGTAIVGQPALLTPSVPPSRRFVLARR